MDIVKPLIGLFKVPKCNIDNSVFKLHYRITFATLVIFGSFITLRQYVGDPIDCISRDDIPSKLLDSFCWVHTTFSLESAWNKTVGVEVPYPGVDKSVPNEERVYHSYYQWVWMLLFFQALMFYMPYILWKTAEWGRTKAISNELKNPVLIEVKRQDQKALLLRFLGGQFSTYGLRVLQFTEWDFSLRFDPMMKVFPRITKCTFHRYGSSGDVQKHDAMCILPVNIFNEKIYIFLWFWFYFLALVSLAALVYRVCTIWSKRMRAYLLTRRCMSMVDAKVIRVLVGELDAGDWFVIYLLGKNIELFTFTEIIEEYSEFLMQEKKNLKNGDFKNHQPSV